MRITRFLRTTTFRLALVYAAVFSLSVILLFAFVYGTTSVLVDRQRQQAIIADINDLKDEFSTLGLTGLLDSVVDRSRPDRVGNGVYLLVDPQFKPERFFRWCEKLGFASYLDGGRRTQWEMFFEGNFSGSRILAKRKVVRK